ncbi:MAG TPA: glycosyltransferase [Solirubrobacterales bacterium]|nr:glycosyltransferase [Solirubrobacterales bacterium]
MPSSSRVPDARQLKERAAKAGVPFLSLDPGDPAGVEIDEGAVMALDGAAARAFGVVPVKAEDGTLLVAVTDPEDAGTLSGVQALTDLRLRVAVAPPDQIRRTQDALYGKARAERPRGSRGGRGEEPPPPTDAQRRLAKAVAREAGLPFVSLEPVVGPGGRRRDPVSHEAARRIGAEVCRAFQVIPVAAVGEGIALATVDPADRAALNIASLLAGLRAWVVVAPEEEIERAIFRVFGSPSGHSASRAAGTVLVPPPSTEPKVAPAAPSVEPDLQPTRPVVPAGRLGEMLLSRGKLTDEQLERALEVQRRQGDRLGEILMHTGVVPEHDVSTTLAEQQELHFTDLATVEPDPETHALIPQEVAQRYRVVPLAMTDGVLQLAMADALDKEALSIVAEHVDCPVRAFVAPPTSVELLLQRIYAESNAEFAATHLLMRSPEESAHQVLSRSQKIVLGTIVALGLISLAIFPLDTIIAFNIASIIFYSAFLIYRFRVTYHSFGHEDELPVSAEEQAALDERRLPIYTILVPLYREAAVLPRLVGSIADLDYPPARLDIKLLLEEDDEETLAAVRALDLPPHFKLVIVPDVGPRTKPKACNYGLTQARGKYVVIYDAEDAPESDQLKKMVVAFAKADDKVACIQCKLNYYNARQNLLTRWFTTEYSMWFDLLLPGLDASGAPIPLGGTSNHFQAERLVEFGAWDPFNVAEDADLGLRLHRYGYKTAIVDSTTYEEATSNILNWVRQRSRWVKGYIQSWLVQMRHPIRLLRQIGLRHWLSFQLTVGGTPAIFLLNPIYWALTTAWLLTEAGIIQTAFPGPVYYISGLGLFIGNFLFAYMIAAGAARRGYFDLVKFAMLAPAYWVLMSWGAWKGFIQLFTKPFYWEKTTHGMTAAAEPSKDPSR